MAASDRTVQQVMEVVRRHVSPEVLSAIMDELEKIPGNKSFRDTVQKMRKLT